MFKISFLYNPGKVDNKTAEKIDIRCGNCGRETAADMDNMNATYQDIITSFVFNTTLHHVGMLSIIETH